MQCSLYREPMDPSGMSDAQQLFRTSGSSPSSEMLCQGQIQSDNPSQDGQHKTISRNIHQQVTISLDLNHLAKEQWLRCMERNILLKAQHLPGVLNTIADDE